MLAAYLTFFVIVMSLTRWLMTRKSGVKRLPGPPKLPFLGNTVQVLLNSRHDPIETVYSKLAEKYGSPFELKVGEVNQVVIEDLETIKTVLLSEDWTDRLHGDYLPWGRNFGKNLGILFGNGKEQKEIRRFSTRASRDFGFGKSGVVDWIAYLEAKDRVQVIDEAIENSNGIVNMHDFFTTMAFNIIWTLVSNSRFPQGDPGVKKLIENMEEVSQKNSVAFSIGFVFPTWVKYTSAGQFARKFHYKIHDFIRQGIQESRNSQRFITGESFFDTFLNEIEKRAGDLNNNLYTDEQMTVVINDLIIAGTHTSSSTLQFAILAVTLHPDVQQKIQDEIEAVIGIDNVPEYSHLKSMPFTEATMCEIIRMAVVIPVIGRAAVQDTELYGCFVPKSSFAIINVVSCQMNEKTWEDPTTFKPERFLNSKNQIVNADKLIAFGLGKRACYGEKVAKITTFITMVTLLQKFKFETTEDTAKAWMKFRRGFAYSTEEYCVKVSRR